MPTDERPMSQIEERIRDAFPADAGLSAEKTRAMYERLKPAPQSRASLGRRGMLRLATAATLTVVFAAAMLFANTRPFSRSTLPDGAASRLGQTASQILPVPQMALAAISTSGDVVHYTSTAETDFGFSRGRSSEEMWLDQASATGRLVKRALRDGAVVGTTTIVASGDNAVVFVEKPGREPSSVRAGANGSWRKEFDKLSTYRNMLESSEVTVTGLGSVDGVETYRMASTIPDFPSVGIDVKMRAEVRVSDYTPVSLTYTYLRRSDGAALGTGSRTFTLFERVRLESLPQGFFRPVLVPGLPATPVVPGPVM